MRRIIALTSGALLWAATLSSMATTPSVSITTSFTEVIPGQEAAVFPGSAWTNSGTFTATPADSPTNHGEWVVLEPDFSWTISPFNSSYLTFNPTNAATVVLSLLNSNAWGYVYTITNIATWSESNIVTHTVQPILPPDGVKTYTMLLDAMKAEIDEIGNVCPKGPHDSHDVYVTITPEGIYLPLTLNLISQSGGAAVFDDTSTEETTIYESQWVTLGGFTYSDFTNDLAMTADFGEGACVSNNFTVYDVDTLTAYEDLHSSNSKPSSSETNDVELEICQLADGSATLNFSLDYWPVDADGCKFRWDMVRADNDEASEEWYAASFDFGAGEVSADWVPDDPATATREFKLRAWFDCDEAGVFDTNYPNRIITVRVVDLDVLQAMCDEHPDNIVETFTRNDAATVLEIGQAEDGTAQMDFDLTWLPGSMDGSRFKWDLVQADDDETAEDWYAAIFDFGAGEVSADWVPDDPATATREFKLRAWYDCDQAGVFDTNYPNRQMTVRVVDLDTLFLTDATDDNNFVWDDTRTNETMSTTNALYLGEDTNGTARMYLDLSWLPSNSDSTNFWYDILQTDGATHSAQWSSSNGTFSADSSVLVTWTNSAAGQTNRIFIVNVWYDCNHNGTNDVDEPHRQLFVIISKADFNIDHVCPKGPHDPHYVTVTVEPRDKPVPVTLELGRITGLGSSGTAVFQSNSSSTLTLDITASNTVTVMGTQHSDWLTNMFMTAKIGGTLCASNDFTVFDVGDMTATEGLHATNTVTSLQENDNKVLDICQGSAADGAAVLNFSMLYYPTNDDAYAMNFLSDFVLTNGAPATNQWQPQVDWFEFGVTNQATWRLPTSGGTNRVFQLRGWFDCNETGEFTNTYPQRIIQVRVVDLEKLVLTNAVGTNAVMDLTRTDEAMAAGNTLYLMEGTNGSAQMQIQAFWAPDAISNNCFRYEILASTASTASPQWIPATNTFATNPRTVTWTNNAAGETNRLFKVNAWYDCNHNGTNDATEPHRQLFVALINVDLEASNKLLTLKHDRDCNLEVKTIPATGITVDEYRIDIKRTNSVTWSVLSANKTMTPWHGNIAGVFHLRGMAKIGGSEFYSTNIVVVNQFPTYTQIEGDTDVRSATDAEWANTLTDCTESPNQRRERGFWFRINTTSNLYEHDAVVTGAWVGPDDGASVNLPSRPADLPANPEPNATGAVYYVSSFHTHTPTTYRTNSVATRGVGPSPGDNNADTADDVPGIVYDYVESPAGSGSIPMGHPKNSAAQRYFSVGKTKRSTP